MENFDWGSFLFYFVITWIAMRIVAIYLRHKNKQLEEELQFLKDRIESRIVNVRIEKYGNIYYLFDKKDDSFIAQGSNMEELKAHCDARFKNKVIIANNDDLSTAGLK